MNLDFTALQDIAPEPPEQDAGKSLPGIPSLQEDRDTAGAMREGITALQEADRLKRALTADLGAGKDLPDVLLTAVDCIGVLSQDAGLYNQCKELLRDKYGYKLREDLQEVRDRIAETEKALRRDDLAPATGRILQRAKRIYTEQAEDLQSKIDALPEPGKADPADSFPEHWEEMAPPEREKYLREWEKDPCTVNGVIKNLRYRRDEIETAGRVLRGIKEKLEHADEARHNIKSWEHTSPEELLELIERKARQR